MRLPVGRWSELHQEPEVRELHAGSDFRHPRYRREVFTRFYEFHLRYKTHPGCVYFALPALWKGLDIEDRYWIAFLNGNTQNPITTWLILQGMPHLPESEADYQRLVSYFSDHYNGLEFDTDRRYHKKEFLKSVARYREAVAETGYSQVQFYEAHISGAQTPEQRFELAWRAVRKYLHSFGRLSTWSYLEYLFIAGLDLEPAGLMLNDLEGSKSHRNGLAKVLGRDDLDWHKSLTFQGDYTDEELEWLEREANVLWAELKLRIPHEHCSLFTLESIFCTYKSWFRKNRRYPNVYADMMHDRIRKAEGKWGPRFDHFWAMRRESLPIELRQEDGPLGGLTPKKQNWFRETGQVIHMDLDWPCFTNTFTPK